MSSLEKELSESKQIYRLKDIAPVRNWDYSLPTITIKGRRKDRKIWADDQSFIQRFQELYPILKEVDISSFAIMGGCVIDLLTGGKRGKDIDMYVILKEENEVPKDISKKLSIEIIKNFLQEIYSYMKEHNNKMAALEKEKRITDPNFRISSCSKFELSNFTVMRYKDIFTINIPSREIPTIQINAMPMNDISMLMSKADLGISSIVYYKGQVSFSSRGKFCFENLAFFANSKSKNISHIKRHEKYFDKGFDIIMPNLNVEKIPRRNLKFNQVEVLDLPYFHVYVNEIDSSRVFAQNVNAPSTQDEKEEMQNNYNEACEKATKNIGQIVHDNISALIHGKYDEFCCYGEDEQFSLAFRKYPLITERMIMNSYQTVKTRLSSQHEFGNTVCLDILDKYFTVEPVSKILEEGILKLVKQRESNCDSRKIFDSAFYKDYQNYLDNLIEKQISQAREMVMKLEKLKDEEYLIEDREKQDELCSASEWYGQYYLS